MKDIIELLRTIEDKHGDDIWISNYVPPVGYYFKINKDNTINSFECKTQKDMEMFKQSTDYDFYKERMFYEGMLMFIANKTVDTGYKRIHSVTSNAIIFKYVSIDKIQEYLNSHFSILKNNYISDLDVDSTVAQFLSYITTIKTMLPDTITDKDRIIIFKDNDLEKYKSEYLIYLNEKVFLSNDTKLTVDDIDYGMFTVGISLNSKKPLLSINPYSNKIKKGSYRISKKDCILLSKAFKLDYATLEGFLKTENPYAKFIYSATGEITDYKMNYKLFSNKDTSYSVISILESEYNSVITKESKGNREDLLKLVNNFTDYLLDKFLNVTDGNYKSLIEKSPNLKIYSSFINNLNSLRYYFNDNGNIDIYNALENILDKYIEFYVLSNDVLHKDNKSLSFYNERRKLDSLFTILNYLNKNGGYLDMSENIKNIWDKLLNSKKEGSLEITSNEEFLFISAQTLNYLSSKSRSANKTGLLIQDVFKLRDFDEIKNKLIEKYGKYLYLLSFHEKSYINIVYNSLITYKIDENVKLNENNNYKYYYQAGLIGKNIFFTKLESTTDLIEEGEGINEEK